MIEDWKNKNAQQSPPHTTPQNVEKEGEWLKNHLSCIDVGDALRAADDAYRAGEKAMLAKTLEELYRCFQRLKKRMGNLIAQQRLDAQSNPMF